MAWPVPSHCVGLSTIALEFITANGGIVVLFFVSF